MSSPTPPPSQGSTSHTSPVHELPKKPKSGIRAALEYTGIPPSIFEKRPKLPSRNWLIFLSVTSSLVGYYAYDRRECKRIRRDYVERVQHLAEVPVGKFALPRKVTVYGAKWPGDEDWDRSTRYFRKYVKPVLVAAAVDYQIIAGRRHGDLATRIANDIKDERRLAAGLDTPWEGPMRSPLKLSLEAERRRKLEGGTIIIGRPTFKEYLAGLRRGWTEPLNRVDPEEALSRELQADGRFDEPEPDEPPSPVGELDEPIPTPSRLGSTRLFSPLDAARKSVQRPTGPLSPPNASATQDGSDVPPPDTIPAQPPLLLVPFVNLVGFTLIPLMVWDFFNERFKVKAGGEAAYKLVVNQTRPFTSPTLDPPSEFASSTTERKDEGDLDFDRRAEWYYKSSTAELPDEIAKSRAEYYKSAVEKLKTARALARREREPTKDEIAHPPPTEVEIHEERLKKEKRWRGEEKGWQIVKPDTPPEWEPRMEGIFKVFVDPPLTHESELGAP